MKRYLQFQAILCTLLLAVGASYGQVTDVFGPDSHLTDVIVIVDKSTIQMPRGVDRATVEHAHLGEPGLRKVLNAIGVQEIIRSFPDAAPYDTVIVSEFGQAIRTMDRNTVYRFRLSHDADVDAAVIELNRTPGLVFAYRVPRYEFYRIHVPMVYEMTMSAPNDQHFASRQWNLHHTGGGSQPPVTAAGGRADIRALEAWEIFKGSSRVKVGIIDTGVLLTHEDLTGKTSGDSYITSHGTHVAAISAAKTDNSVGISGVDWNAQLISKNIWDFTPENIYDKIISAVSDGAHILNNSWGTDASGGANDFLVHRAFAAAHKANVLSVAASGNDYGQLTNYPAGLWQVMAVGSSDHNNLKSPFSTWGSHLDVVAPGGTGNGGNRDIYSAGANSDNHYYYSAGTSMAAPHVAGIASLLRGYAQDHMGITLHNDDLRNLVRLSADKVRTDRYQYNANGRNEQVGYGRVNARKALDLLRSPNELIRTAVTGGTTHSTTGQHSMIIFDVSGLPNTSYIVRRHEVRRSITFPQTHLAPAGRLWCRGAASTGWALPARMGNHFAQFGMGWCEPVPGTVTSTSATLRTYVYEVWNSANMSFLGWYPTHPNGTTFAYTVLREVLPLAVTIAGPPSVQSPASAIYTANPTGGSGAYTYGWYTKELAQQGWLYTGVTTQSYQHQFGSASDIVIRVEVANAGQTASAIRRVTVCPEGSFCPYSTGAPEVAGLAEQVTVPVEFALEANYPNPFNPRTTIRFALPEAAQVTVVVVDLLGREMARLVDGRLEAGYHTASVDASTWASGVYLYRLEATGAERTPHFTQTRRMTIAR